MGRLLHFDCFSGISGDMTVGALLDLGVPESIMQDALGSLGLNGQLRVNKIRKGGFAATKIDVETPHEHAHRHLSHIRKIIEAGRMTDGARALALKLFEKLGEAEAAAHGIPIEKVHFHEVGAVDSIFDFVATAVGLDYLAVDRITASPVPTGCGQVRCEHGTLAVPVPAVARLLTGIPLAPCTIEAELTTPTGAAILATVVDEFVRQPVLTIEKIGLGAGTRDLPQQANVLRLLLGQAQSESSATVDTIWQIETNIDDCSPELVGYCLERLFESGALDVYSTAIQMKKNRPGTLLTVLCPEESVAAIENVLFQETGTFGLRKSKIERSKLERLPVEVATSWGTVRGKLGWNDQVRVFSPEFEDCARIAREHKAPLRQVYQEVIRQFQDNQTSE